MSNQSPSSSLEKFLFGGLLGLVLGGVIGLLLAPQSGEETRSRVKDTLKHKGEEGLSAARTRLDEAKSGLKEGYASTYDQLKESAVHLKHRAEELSKELERVGKSAYSKFKGDKPNGTSVHASDDDVINVSVEEEPSVN
jgi:gas vesicle protein